MRTKISLPFTILESCCSTFASNMFSLPASAMLENRHVTKCEATGPITGMQHVQTCESAKGARKVRYGSNLY